MEQYELPQAPPDILYRLRWTALGIVRLERAYIDRASTFAGVPLEIVAETGRDGSSWPLQVDLSARTHELLTWGDAYLDLGGTP